MLKWLWRTYGLPLLLGLLFAATIKSLVLENFFIPLTPSEPLVLYKRDRTPNRYVLFCLPIDKQKDAKDRGIARGSCPGGIQPFMKEYRVIHNGVQLSPAGAYVDGVLLRNTAPKHYDHQGRPLTPFPFGYYKAEDNTIWTFSTYNEDSYDSRYFGPIQRTQIIGYAHPLF
jgi:conjugative transfer signal peptidase TraF